MFLCLNSEFEDCQIHQLSTKQLNCVALTTMTINNREPHESRNLFPEDYPPEP